MVPLLPLAFDKATLVGESTASWKNAASVHDITGLVGVATAATMLAPVGARLDFLHFHLLVILTSRSAQKLKSDRSCRPVR
jgi:hypothetical protein